MLSPHKLSPIIILAAVTFLALGEILTGTGIYFVSLMSLTMFCIGATYNILGGLSTYGGFYFTAYAMGTIVISQFAKVVLWERADKNLEAPNLTITVYLAFYFSAMAGSYLFSKVRLGLPKALDPSTTAHTMLTYWICLIFGVIGVSGALKGADVQNSAARIIWLAAFNLVYFPVVLATGHRIRVTNGQHSAGVLVAIPTVFLVANGLFNTARQGIALPFLVYAATCYVNGYRFRRKHYLAAALGIVTFVGLVSPVALYLRQFGRPQGVLSGDTEVTYQLLPLPEWATIMESSAGAEQANEGRAGYYDRAGTFVLSRVSMIRVDSDLISACSAGFHYGFEPMLSDLQMLVPAFINPSKPQSSSHEYIGRVAGLQSDDQENTYASFSAISDSYGAFGWMGVAIVGLLFFPLIAVVYESLFDISRPWGIVALGVICGTGWGSTMGNIPVLLIRIPLELIALSYVIGWVVRMVPSRGDR